MPQIKLTMSKEDWSLLSYALGCTWTIIHQAKKETEAAQCEELYNRLAAQARQQETTTQGGSR